MCLQRCSERTLISAIKSLMGLLTARPIFENFAIKKKMMLFSKLKKRMATPFIAINPRDCIACWECVEACPKDVLGKVDFLGHRHVKIVNADACIGCNKCIRICPKGVFTSLK